MIAPVVAILGLLYFMFAEVIYKYQVRRPRCSASGRSGCDVTVLHSNRIVAALQDTMVLSLRGMEWNGIAKDKSFLPTD